MAAFHGKTGQVLIAIGSGGTPAVVAWLNEWTLDMATDKAETTSFGATNRTYVQGLPDLKGTVAGFFDSTSDLLWQCALSPTGVQMKLLPATSVPSVFFAGPAWFDASISVGVDAAVTIKGTFSANGSWTVPGMAGTATGAAPGTAGGWTPQGSAVPYNLVALQTATPPVVATPTTAWTAGQGIQLRDLTYAHWNGTAWVAGLA